MFVITSAILARAAAYAFIIQEIGDVMSLEPFLVLIHLLDLDSWF